MKRITVILDGSADRPNAVLGGKTPLEFASTPNMDALARVSSSGVSSNIPSGLEIGSAVANMGLLGFDPREYRGRSALEAAGSNIATVSENMYIRMNLVHLSGDSYDSAVMENYSARDISTEDAKPIIAKLMPLFKKPYILHHMESFRSTLEIEDGAKFYPYDLSPAHDIIGQPISAHQHSKGAEALYALQREAFELLRDNGTYANGVWFWGDSVAPRIARAEEGRFVMSETVLMRGITAVTMLPNYPTNEAQPFASFLREKAIRASELINTEYDRAYLHIQATDDLSHDKDPLAKARAISDIDRAFFGELLPRLRYDYALLILSDHYTFSDTGAHGGAPVPYILRLSDDDSRFDRLARFTEEHCRKSGVTTDAKSLVELMESFA